MGKVKSRARIIVPCRFGYLHCWRANSFGNGNEKYSVSAIISKDDKETLKEIEEAIEYVKEHSIAKWGGRIPVTLRTPLHDGDLEKPDHAAFAMLIILMQRAEISRKLLMSWLSRLLMNQKYIPDVTER